MDKKKSNKLKNILFWFFAVLPLALSDVILRYVLNASDSFDGFYTAVPILFTIFWSVLVIDICWGLFPKKLGKIIYVVFTSVFGIWFFSNFISYKLFSKYLWFKNISLFSEATDYLSSVFVYMTPIVIFTIIIYIISIVIACILWEKPSFKRGYTGFFIAILAVCGILVTEIAMDNAFEREKNDGAWEVWTKPALIYEKFTNPNKSMNIAGFYQYTFKSIYQTIFDEDDISLEMDKRVADFFEEKKNQPDNEMTGILKDKNVIFVMMESIDDWMISDTYTPTLNSLMKNSINFTNHYMPNIGAGYTFNSEFAANTGYYCPSTETSASIFTGNSYPYTIGNILKKQGYNTTSLHFNRASFYNRGTMHKALGYSDYICTMDHLPIDKCVMDSETAKSDKLYQEMTEGEKFLDFFITYTPHLPYDTVDAKLENSRASYPEIAALDEYGNEEVKNALTLARETDAFFEVLIERLKQDGLYEDTVIIAFSDHYAYGINDKELLKQLSKSAGSELHEKVPFFIHSPSLKPMEVTKLTTAVDILPTVLNMLGFTENYYLGNDAFDESFKSLLYFPNDSWYDGEIYFKGDDISQYDEKTQEYIKSTHEEILSLRGINNYVVSTNYFSRHK